MDSEDGKGETTFDTDVEPTPALWETADWVHLITSADERTLDYDLKCVLCGEILGRAEDGSSLGGFLRIALAHTPRCDG